MCCKCYQKINALIAHKAKINSIWIQFRLKLNWTRIIDCHIMSTEFQLKCSIEFRSKKIKFHFEFSKIARWSSFGLLKFNWSSIEIQLKFNENWISICFLFGFRLDFTWITCNTPKPPTQSLTTLHPIPQKRQNVFQLATSRGLDPALVPASTTQKKRSGLVKGRPLHALHHHSKPPLAREQRIHLRLRVCFDVQFKKSNKRLCFCWNSTLCGFWKRKTHFE